MYPPCGICNSAVLGKFTQQINCRQGLSPTQKILYQKKYCVSTHCGHFSSFTLQNATQNVENTATATFPQTGNTARQVKFAGQEFLQNKRRFVQTPKFYSDICAISAVIFCRHSCAKGYISKILLRAIQQIQSIFGFLRRRALVKYSQTNIIVS